MEAASERRQWTYADLATFPDDGKRYEIIGGDLHISPVQSPLHQIVLMNVLSPVYSFAREHDLGWVCVGPIGVCLTRADYVEPDLVFLRRERTKLVGELVIEGAPDLVVEVASAGTVDRDRGLKRELYARFGVSEYWIVDADAGQVEVYRTLVDPAKPEVVREMLAWRPVPGGPTLELSVPELLADLD